MNTPRQAVIPNQTDTIKAHLMKGATISKWDSYKRYQITCLAQRIYDLRKAGVKIQGKSVTKNGKRFEVYWIEEEDRVLYAGDKVSMPNDPQRMNDNVATKDSSILTSIDEVTIHE